MSNINLPTGQNPDIKEVFELEVQFPDKNIIDFYNEKNNEYKSFINSILEGEKVSVCTKYSESFLENLRKELGKSLQNLETHREKVQHIIKVFIQNVLKENEDNEYFFDNTLKNDYISVTIGYHIIQNKEGRDVLYYKDTNLHFIPNKIVEFLKELEQESKSTIVDIVEYIVEKKLEKTFGVGDKNLIKQYTETYDNRIKWKAFKSTYEIYEYDIEKTLRIILSMNLWNQSKNLGEYIKFIKEGKYNFEREFKITPTLNLKNISPKEVYEYFVVTVIESFFVNPSYISEEISEIIEEKKLGVENILKDFKSILAAKPVYLYNIEPVGDVFLTVLIYNNLENTRVEPLLELLFKTLFEEIFREYSGITRNSYLEEERQKFALNSAISAIMSRNGSHNIGSHVIYNVVSNIDSLNVQDHKFFFRYLQHRFDFLAGITTYFLSKINLISSHSFLKEIVRYFLEQKHILSYIALSEGITFSNMEVENKKNVPIIKVRKARLSISGTTDTLSSSCKDGLPYEIVNNIEENNGHHMGIDILLCHGKDCENDKIDEDFEVDIPLGIIGFHALYTIIENIIRNISKHSYYPSVNKSKPLHISVDLIDCKEDEEYFHLVIWDNYSKVSGLVNYIYKEISSLEEKNVYLLNLKDKEIYKKTDTAYELYRRNIQGEDFILEELEDLQKDENNVFFIISDEKKTLDKNLYKHENVRIIPKEFIEYNRIKANGKINHEYLDTLIKEFYEPVHIKLNKYLLKEIIDEKGELNKEYWGLKEMLIASSFLAMEDLRILNENNLWKLYSSLKAVPIYNKENKEYILGFEFRVKKSKDILWLVEDEFLSKESNILPSLKKDGIYPIPKNYDLTFQKAQHFILINENHYLIQLINTNIDETYEIIEKFPGIRIGVIVSSEEKEKIKEKIENYKFLKFRLFFLEKNKFYETFSICKKRKNFDGLKVCVLTEWLNHLKSIKELKEINLLFQPYIKGFEISESNSNLKNEIIEYLKENCYDIEKINEDIIDEFVSYISEKYGIYSKNYIPDTLPDSLKKENSVSLDLSQDKDVSTLKFLNIVKSCNSEVSNCIIFKRHTDCTDCKGALYCENVKGNAAHFPAIANIPAEKDKKLYFIKSLIECGLLKIGVVDERFNETLQRKESLKESLLKAGVYSINKFLEAKIDSPYGNDYFINIGENSSVEMNVDIDILIIHQGFLDNKINIKNVNIETMPNETKLDSVIRKLKNHIPLIYITSGRGVPNNLPKNVRFIPFSSIEQTLLSEPHSKYNLIKSLM